MIGLAARPGIEVEPMWSIRNAASPTAARCEPARSRTCRPARVVVDDHDSPHGLEAADEDSLQVVLPSRPMPHHGHRGSVAAVVTHLDASTASVDDVVGALEADGYCIVEGMLRPPKWSRRRPRYARCLMRSRSAATTSRGSARVASTRCSRRHERSMRRRSIRCCSACSTECSATISCPLRQASRSAPGEKAQALHYDASIYPLPRDFTRRRREHHVGARRLHRGERRDSNRARQPPVGRPPTWPRRRGRGCGHARRIGHLLRRQGLPWRGSELAPRAPPGRHPRVRQRMAAAPGDASPRRAEGGRCGPARPPAGASGIQHLPTVRGLRRRASSAPLHHDRFGGLAMTDHIDDYDGITRVVQLYIDGSKPRRRRQAERSVPRRRRDVRPCRRAPLRHAHRAVLRVRRGLADGRRRQLRASIISVQQVGDAAVATLAEEGCWGEVSFVDYFSFGALRRRLEDREQDVCPHGRGDAGADHPQALAASCRACAPVPRAIRIT